MKNLLISLFILFYLTSNAVASLNSVDNIESLQSNNLFELSNIIFEAVESRDHLIYATRTLEKKPKIVFSTALFKELELKEIEEILLFCHELGHFKAGAPFKKRGRTQKDSWSSSEGQSDYFSTVHCIKEFNLKKKSFTEVEKLDTQIEIREICLQSNHPDCYKVINSIFMLVKTYQSWTHEQNELNFLNINLSPTRYTILTYPSNQCRLVTLINGFLCDEYDFMTYECLDENYRRPQCWFGK